MKTIELNVEKRSTIGKNEARRSRAKGKIPAVVYGAKKPTVPISVDRKALTDAFRGGGGENAIFLLKLAGTDQARHVMIVDDPEKVIVHVTHPTAEKEPEVAAAEAVPEITEPEVLKKGKAATEEEAEGEKEKEKEKEK